DITATIDFRNTPSPVYTGKTGRGIRLHQSHAQITFRPEKNSHSKISIGCKCILQQSQPRAYTIPLIFFYSETKTINRAGKTRFPTLIDEYFLGKLLRCSKNLLNFVNRQYFNKLWKKRLLKPFMDRIFLAGQVFYEDDVTDVYYNRWPARQWYVILRYHKPF